MKSLEKFWYESFPYLCAAIGLVTVVEANKIAGAFGSSLALTSVLIIRDRCVYRFKHRRLAPYLRKTPTDHWPQQQPIDLPAS